jgi:hypothetical protein
MADVALAEGPADPATAERLGARAAKDLLAQGAGRWLGLS